MYGISHRGAGMYARLGTETAAHCASPHQLIAMLFDGAACAIAMARHQLVQKNIKAKGESIAKAVDIVSNGLQAALDPAAAGAEGEALVGNLAELYGYIVRRLTYANLHNDVAALDEAARLLENVASAWREIDPAGRPAAPGAPVLLAAAA